MASTCNTMTKKSFANGSRSTRFGSRRPLLAIWASHLFSLAGGTRSWLVRKPRVWHALLKQQPAPPGEDPLADVFLQSDANGRPGWNPWRFRVGGEEATRSTQMPDLQTMRSYLQLSESFFFPVEKVWVWRCAKRPWSDCDPAEDRVAHVVDMSWDSLSARNEPDEANFLGRLQRECILNGAPMSPLTDLVNDYTGQLGFLVREDQGPTEGVAVRVAEKARLKSEVAKLLLEFGVGVNGITQYSPAPEGADDVAAGLIDSFASLETLPLPPLENWEAPPTPLYFAWHADATLLQLAHYWFARNDESEMIASSPEVLSAQARLVAVLLFYGGDFFELFRDAVSARQINQNPGERHPLRFVMGQNCGGRLLRFILSEDGRANGPMALMKSRVLCRRLRFVREHLEQMLLAPPIDQRVAFQRTGRGEDQRATESGAQLTPLLVLPGDAALQNAPFLRVVRDNYFQRTDVAWWHSAIYAVLRRRVRRRAAQSTTHTAPALAKLYPNRERALEELVARLDDILRLPELNEEGENSHHGKELAEELRKLAAVALKVNREWVKILKEDEFQGGI